MTATPIYDALVLERAGATAREIVRAAFSCPTCGAPYGQPCTTTTGKVARVRHRGRL